MIHKYKLLCLRFLGVPYFQRVELVKQYYASRDAVRVILWKYSCRDKPFYIGSLHMFVLRSN